MPAKLRPVAIVAEVPTHFTCGARQASRRPAYQQGDIGALTATVGVQLVEDEESQRLSSADQPVSLHGPGEEVLQHDVVGQQDVWPALQDPVPGLGVLLAGVLGKGDPPLVAGDAPGEVLL